MKCERGNVAVLILGGLALIFAALAGYFYLSSSAKAPEGQAKPVEISPAPFDETANWKTYTDSTFQLSFKYPNDWQNPKITIRTKTEEPWWEIEGNYLNFNDTTLDTGLIYVELTKYESYENEPMKKRISRLKEIFSTKQVTDDDTLWLPPSNAAIGAASPVTYLENSDRSFRGIYYFANIGQDDSDYNIEYSRLFNLIIILTDGKEKIVQFHISKPLTNNPTDYLPINNCQNLSLHKKCKVNVLLQKDFEQIYKEIISSVKSI